MRATALLLIGAAFFACACKRQEIYSRHAVLAPTPVSSAATGTPDFVGRWAASRADCLKSPWILTPAELDTPGRTRCAFAKLSSGSAGYSADVACSGPGPNQISRITLTLSGQGDSRGLTLAGGPFTLPVALTPCPGTPG